ncbi:MAG: enoyl-CoA hydratase-related protein [Nevskia sp.]|nr:enoyl-CoA hydratase-related protein [Nevskia sp.]
MTQPLLVSIEDGIATLTLNRPAVGNALDMPMARALLEAAIRCDQDESIRCVVLTGTGKLFCGGGDLQAFAEAGDAMPAFFSELAGLLHMTVTRLMRMPKPLLVAVNGSTGGGGMSLALAGDIVIAARSASFTTAHSSVGLSTDVGMSWHLPRLVGLRRAQDMILTNRRISAEEAERIGLITRVVDDAALMQERESYARKLAMAPVSALGRSRALLIESFNSPLEQQLEREVRAVVSSARSEESREGIQAFLEKRKPTFVK